MGKKQTKCSSPDRLALAAISNEGQRGLHLEMATGQQQGPSCCRGWNYIVPHVYTYVRAVRADPNLAKQRNRSHYYHTYCEERGSRLYLHDE